MIKPSPILLYEYRYRYRNWRMKSLLVVTLSTLTVLFVMAGIAYYFTHHPLQAAVCGGEVGVCLLLLTLSAKGLREDYEEKQRLEDYLSDPHK